MIKKPFEKVRSELSHDRLKHEFLSTIAYDPESKEKENREQIMREAIEGKESAVQLLQQGCKTWRSLGPDIKNFLATLTPVYGFVMSESFEKEHAMVETALEEVAMLCTKIGVGEFVETDITLFWEAIDKIVSLLSDMSKSRKFRDYVLDIDSRLIKA